MGADSVANSSAGAVSADRLWRVHRIQGRESILRLAPLLAELSAIFEQPGAYADLEFILTRPSTLKKRPHLLLFAHYPQKDLQNCSAGDLAGALLIHEYQVLGVGAGIYMTDDSTGRRTLVAPPGLQTAIARLAARSFLIDHEILLGTRRLYIEGGTQHALRNSFETGQVADLLVLRHLLLISLLRRFSGSLMDKDNLLGQMLADPELHWQAWQS